MTGGNPSGDMSSRKSWSTALGFWAVVSVVGWVLIAGLFLSMTPDDSLVAVDQDAKTLNSLAPAAGPSTAKGKSAD